MKQSRILDLFGYVQEILLFYCSNSLKKSRSQIEDKKTWQVLIRREVRFNPGLMNEKMNEFESQTFR